MSNNRIDRARELSKLWFQLNKPKKGDIIKFLVDEDDTVHEGVIVDVRIEGDKVNYKMVSQTAKSGTNGRITVLECNGQKYGDLGTPD